jgi:hypothetical protein
LVAIVTQALRACGTSADSSSCAALSSLSSSGLQASDMQRCFGAALGLLSMQRDLLDSLALSAVTRNLGAQAWPADDEADDVIAASTAASSSSSGAASLQQRAARQAKRMTEQQASEKQQHLRMQFDVLSAMQMGLWEAVLAANTPTWLELSCYPSLGPREEQRLCEECWFFQAVRGTAAEVRAGRMRGDMLPVPIPAAAAAAGGGGSGIGGGSSSASEQQQHVSLQAAIAQSGLPRKQLSGDGEVVEIPPGRPANHRAEHLVKVCYELAMSARLDPIGSGSDSSAVGGGGGATMDQQ